MTFLNHHFVTSFDFVVIPVFGNFFHNAMFTLKHTEVFLAAAVVVLIVTPVVYFLFWTSMLDCPEDVFGGFCEL